MKGIIMSKPKAILIAEKPSLMRTIEAVYKANKDKIPYDIDFYAQAGHLLELKMPDEIHPEYKKWSMGNYPMDLEFEYKVKPQTRAILNTIKGALKQNNYDVVIHAGDPDQEGELLIRETLDYCHNKLPVKRFWSNDLTPNAVLHTLMNLEDDSKYDGFMDAAVTRQKQDYSYGMNLTGAMTVKQGVLTRIGRVKAAIIKLIVERELDIKNFKPSSSFRHAFYNNEFKFIGENEYKTEDEAKNTIPKSASITDISLVKKKIKAPKLYKLVTAQADAYGLYNIPATKTLEIIQSLYEKGYVSYPRTDCEYVSEDTDAIGIIESLGHLIDIPENSLQNPNTVKKDKTYFNNKAIMAEGHTALIPTGKVPQSITGDEKNVYYMILRRFIAIFAEPKEIEMLSMSAVDNLSEKYMCKVSQDITAGFERILNPTYTLKKVWAVNDIPSEGNVSPIKWNTHEVKAKCPPRYTNASLLLALDHPSTKVEGVVYSIGTPATRSNIVADTKRAGYFTESRGKYFATDFAIKTIQNFKDLSLFDVETTGLWEKNLSDVRSGKMNVKLVDQGMTDELNKEIETVKTCVIEWPQTKPATQKKTTNTTIKPLNLECPICHKPLQETDKAFGCSGWREGCKYAIWKNILGNKLTLSDIEKGFNGETITKSLTSKAGNHWDQKLKLNITGGKFEFVK